MTETERPADAIDLPHGGWARLKSPKELTNRSRIMLRKYAIPFYALRAKLMRQGVTQDQLETDPVSAAGGLTADDLEVINAAQAAFIVAYLDKWSLTVSDGSPLPLPTMDTVDDLTAEVFDILATSTSKLGDGTVETSEPSVDPESPTEPSFA